MTMTQLEEVQLENESLKTRLNDSEATIAALTLKVTQLQNALDDKESQFRDLIRRYAKRDAHTNSIVSATATNGHSNGGSAKNGNGSATNVSSSGVSIQSNGETTQPSSAAISPSAVSTQSQSTQNRSLADSATQTTISEDESGLDEQSDSNGSHNNRGSNSQRQVSFDLAPSPNAVSRRGNNEVKSRRSMTNASNGSGPDLKHSRTASNVAVPFATQQQHAGALNRISYAAEYGLTQRNETDYFSLSTFASVNQQSNARPPSSGNDTDDSATVTSHPASTGSGCGSGLAQNRLSNSALPSVIPVPMPVRVEARRPDSLNRPANAPVNGHSPNHPIMSFIASSAVQPQPQTQTQATYSTTSLALTPNGGLANQPSIANTPVTFAQPVANGSSQSAIDKQELARRCLDLPVAEWKAGHVMAWLEVYAGLQPFLRKCAENVKSGAILSSMSDAELEQAIGLEHPLHKRKLQMALAELRVGRYNPQLKINSLSHNWIARTWLRDIGLSQYAPHFEQALVDGRLLTLLNKKDLEKYLHVEKKSHQASLTRSLEFLRRFSFDMHAINERRGRCEYVNADLLVWTNRRLAVWLKEIDLIEYSNVEQTGLNGAYILYESLSMDSLCNALGIPSNKPHVRKHLEAKFNELAHAPLPAPSPNSAVQAALMNGVMHSGPLTSAQNGHALAANSGSQIASHHSVYSQNGATKLTTMAPNASAVAFTAPSNVPFSDLADVGALNRNYAYDLNQLDYINMDANTPNDLVAQKSSRNYVTFENVQKDNQVAVLRNGNNYNQQMQAAMKPTRNGEHRVRLEEPDYVDQDQNDAEQNGSKFVRSSSANRSTGRKIANLRNSIGKAFSKKSALAESDRVN